MLFISCRCHVAKLYPVFTKNIGKNTKRKSCHLNFTNIFDVLIIVGYDSRANDGVYTGFVPGNVLAGVNRKHLNVEVITKFSSNFC